MRRAQEDFPPKGGASKRKLKKDRRAKRQELADEAQSECVTWDEDQASKGAREQLGGVLAEPCGASLARRALRCSPGSRQELLLLKQMGWAICEGARVPPPPTRARAQHMHTTPQNITPITTQVQHTQKHNT